MSFNKYLKKNGSFIVAEIGNNHEGNYNTALRLIDKASEAKVDAVKFQSFNVNSFYSSDIELSRVEKLKKFSLNYQQFKNLSLYAKKRGLIFFSTPLDISYVKILNRIQPIFKVASGDNDYYELIFEILKCSKPTIISCGLMNFKEIRNLYLKIKKKINKNKIAFMHCVSSYPAKDENLNLDAIYEMKKILPGCLIGYSDHSIGIDACIYASSIGAKIIEKHFTLSHNFSDFRDHKLSATPKEMTELVNKIRKVKIIKGSRYIKPSNDEKKNLTSLRRSIALKKNVSKNSKIRKDDLIMLRPGTGLDYRYLKKIIGKSAKVELKKNQLIKKNFFK